MMIVVCAFFKKQLLKHSLKKSIFPSAHENEKYVNNNDTNIYITKQFTKVSGV